MGEVSGESRGEATREENTTAWDVDAEAERRAGEDDEGDSGGAAEATEGRVELMEGDRGEGEGEGEDGGRTDEAMEECSGGR